MNGMLEHACTIAERKEMSDPNLRYGVPASPGADRIDRESYSTPGILALSIEDSKIALCRLHPGHRSACRVGAFTHGIAADVVGQETRDFGAQSFGIGKGDQNAAPIAQQFLGVPVGRRHDGLSQSEAVSKCARCHLGFVEIR